MNKFFAKCRKIPFTLRKPSYSSAQGKIRQRFEEEEVVEEKQIDFPEHRYRKAHRICLCLAILLACMLAGHVVYKFSRIISVYLQNMEGRFP
jgi:hypothetical protein